MQSKSGNMNRRQTARASAADKSCPLTSPERSEQTVALFTFTKSDGITKGTPGTIAMAATEQFCDGGSVFVTGGNFQDGLARPTL